MEVVATANARAGGAEAAGVDLRRLESAVIRRRIAQGRATEVTDVVEIKRVVLAAVERELDRHLAGLKVGQPLAFHFGVTVLGAPSERTSPQATEWRRRVFERDGYRCRESARGGRLHAHHVRPWADEPEMRFDIENGLTLCVDCHAKRHPRHAALIRRARYHAPKG